jgi:hypothetical protein
MKKLKSHKGYQTREQVIASKIRKATICNIWINLGDDNSYAKEHVSKTAEKIAIKIGIVETVGAKPKPDDVIAWVKENKPLLLTTAKTRHAKKSLSPRPKYQKQQTNQPKAA